MFIHVFMIILFAMFFLLQLCLPDQVPVLRLQHQYQFQQIQWIPLLFHV